MIEKSMLVYIGTYTNFPPRKTGLGEGIYIYRLSLTDGALTPVGVAAGVANPSFLTVDTVHHRLFAVNEVGHFAGEQGGGASAFSINPQDGTLNFLNAQPTHGGATCYISLDHTKKWALVSNYSGGNIAVLPILPDGRLGAMTAFVQHVGSSVNADRQQTAYAHSIIMDPTDRFALAADLGMDKIMVYKLDHETGQLMPNSVPWVKTRPGSGPRHMAFNAKGDLLYVAHELDSTVSVFRWDSAAGVPAPNQAGVPAPNQAGVLTEIQTLPMLPENFTDDSTAADIHLTPSGKFLYATNRGHDSLALFAVDAASGLLVPFGHVSTQGRTPRNFAIDPTGTILLVANQQSSNVVAFRIDPENGHLTATGQVTSVPAPVCVQIVDWSV